MDLKKMPTKELVEELVSRTGVTRIIAEPEQYVEIKESGPAIILVVKD